MHEALHRRRRRGEQANNDPARGAKNVGNIIKVRDGQVNKTTKELMILNLI